MNLTLVNTKNLLLCIELGKIVFRSFYLRIIQIIDIRIKMYFNDSNKNVFKTLLFESEIIQITFYSNNAQL